MVDCLDSEPRLAQSQTGDMRLYSRRLGEAAAPGGGECGPCYDFASYTLAFALQLGKITEKPQSGQPKGGRLITKMEKAKHNQICNLECKRYSPQSRGTGQCIK